MKYVDNNKKSNIFLCSEYLTLVTCVIECVMCKYERPRFAKISTYRSCFFIQQNKQILIDAVVHAVNEDYGEMANDFTRLGFLASGTDVTPIVPALESIWQNSSGKGLSDFNFRSVTGFFSSNRMQFSDLLFLMLSSKVI